MMQKSSANFLCFAGLGTVLLYFTAPIYLALPFVFLNGKNWQLNPSSNNSLTPIYWATLCSPAYEAYIKRQSEFCSNVYYDMYFKGLHF